jgi:hypothetical protein
MLRRCLRVHPKARIEARVARNTELLDRIDTNELISRWSGTTRFRRGRSFEAAPGKQTARPPCARSGYRRCRGNPDAEEPLPLAAFDGACLFFSMATTALDGANNRWRVAFLAGGRPLPDWA